MRKASKQRPKPVEAGHMAFGNFTTTCAPQPILTRDEVRAVTANTARTRGAGDKHRQEGERVREQVRAEALNVQQAHPNITRRAAAELIAPKINKAPSTTLTLLKRLKLFGRSRHAK